MNTLSETPAGLDYVLSASDPRYLRFELDTAHAVAGGGDPALMIEQYRDRLSFMHLKDVVDLAAGGKGKYPFQFDRAAPQENQLALAEVWQRHQLCAFRLITAQAAELLKPAGGNEM